MQVSAGTSDILWRSRMRRLTGMELRPGLREGMIIFIYISAVGVRFPAPQQGCTSYFSLQRRAPGLRVRGGVSVPLSALRTGYERVKLLERFIYTSNTFMFMFPSQQMNACFNHQK